MQTGPSRPHGPEALLEALPGDRDGDPAYAQLLLTDLDRAVGGRRMLLDLDEAPLPAEPFEWAGVPDDTIGYSGWLQSQELEGWFGTKGVSQRGNVFLQAIGVNPYDQFGAMELSSPDFLVAERRRTLTRRRDECLTMLES